jgi:hypothetical protein
LLLRSVTRKLSVSLCVFVRHFQRYCLEMFSTFKIMLYSLLLYNYWQWIVSGWQIIPSLTPHSSSLLLLTIPFSLFSLTSHSSLLLLLPPHYYHFLLSIYFLKPRNFLTSFEYVLNFCLSFVSGIWSLRRLNTVFPTQPTGLCYMENWINSLSFSCHMERFLNACPELQTIRTSG